MAFFKISQKFEFDNILSSARKVLERKHHHQKQSAESKIQKRLECIINPVTPQGDFTQKKFFQKP